MFSRANGIPENCFIIFHEFALYDFIFHGKSNRLLFFLRNIFLDIHQHNITHIKKYSHKSKGNIISKMLMSMTLTSRSLSWVEMVQRNKRNSVRGLVLKVTEVSRDGTA